MEVYGLFGHGCDIITDRPDTTDRPMPADCIYVTIVLCGLYSHYLAKLMYAFQDPYIKDALKHPIENLEKLNHYFTMQHGNIGTEPIIHIHAAGTDADTYVDSLNSFLFDVGGYAINRSGLYKLGDLKPLNGEPKFIEDNGEHFMRESSHPFPGALDPRLLMEIYKKSLIQPAHFTDPATGAPFTSIADFKRDNLVGLAHKLSDLFSMRPGIYYNFACRPSCDAAHQVNTEGRRIRSRSKQVRAGYYPRLGYDMAPALPAPDVIAAIDYRVTQSQVEWFNERARITLEFIISKRRKNARESERLLHRRRNMDRLKTSRKARSTTQKLRGPKGAKTRTLGRRSRA